MRKTDGALWAIALWSLFFHSGCGTVDKSTEDWTRSSAPSGKSSVCGNHKAEPGEVCDGADVRGQTCEAVGFADGSLSCLPNCSNFNLALCGAPESCGNDVQENGELCDGSDLAEQTCADLGFAPGTLSCLANCGGFDTSQCGPSLTCGNGIHDANELCDGAHVGAATCAALGFDGGDLQCGADCQSHDTSGCSSACNPDCSEHACGPDPVCGQSCGSCAAGVCSEEGICLLEDPNGPNIHSLVASPSSVSPGGSVTITALVTHAEGAQDIVGESCMIPPAQRMGFLQMSVAALA